MFPASLDCSALLEAAGLGRGVVSGRVPGEDDLTMIPSKSWETPTLVAPPAVAAIEAGDDTLAELAVGAVVAGPAVTGVALDTFPSVLTGPGAHPALTPRALEARGTLTETGGRAVASVHALRLTDRLGAKTTFPARSADTPT